MLVSTANQIYQHDKVLPTNRPLSPSIQIKLDSRIEKNLAALSPETPWGERQIAARNLGNLKDAAAVPGLVETLLEDDFWMVRCAIIQALEKIGDPSVIPALIQVIQQDSFQVVRSYAKKGIERLSRK